MIIMWTVYYVKYNCYVLLHHRSGHLDVVKYLVDQGVNVNAKNRDSHTPMDVARL